MRSLKVVLASFFLILALIFVLPPISRGQQDAGAQNQQDQKPQYTKKQQKEREKQLMQEVNNPYKNWISGPIAYIISPDERKAFDELQTNEQREQFIENFWARRNPNPDSEYNSFKEDFYQRVEYANEHYSSGIPGWKTDRGRIYIMWGPPDETDSHPSGGSYERPASEGGGETSTYPFEDWTYNYLPGIGENVKLEFVDPTMTGEYHLTIDPSEKDALLYVPGAGLTQMEAMGMASKTDRFMNTDGTHDAAPIGGAGAMPDSMDEFNRLELYSKIFQAPPVKFKDLETIVTSHVIRNQIGFQWRADHFRIVDSSDLVPVTIQIPNSEIAYKEKDGVEAGKLEIFGRVSTLAGRVEQTFEDYISPTEVLPSQLALARKGQSLYQKAIPLRPGLYELDLVVKDQNSGNIGVIDTRLPVPQYEDSKLSTSSLVLADEIGGVSANNIGLGEFVIGDVKVRPRLGTPPGFKTNETMGIYMQVYNLQMDPKTHQANVTVHYLITRGKQKVLDQTDTTQQIAKQLGHNVGVQFPIEERLPLAGMAPGRYQLQVTVADNTSQQQLVRTADFTVEPAAPPATSEAKE